MIQNKSVHVCLYVENHVVISCVSIVNVTFISVRVCAHRQSWPLSAGQCGCAAAVWCGGLLCPGPPGPRPRPDHTLASAAVKSHVPRARLEGGKRDIDLRCWGCVYQHNTILRQGMYPESEGVWAWGTLRCPRRPAGCVGQPEGTGAAELGPGGQRGAPWWSEVVSLWEWLPADPPRSATPHPAGDNEKKTTTQQREIEKKEF